MLFRRLLPAVFLVLAVSPNLSALELEGTEPESGGIAVHGFASQGALLSTGNNYLAESKRGSFEMAEVGINFTKQLTDQLRFGVQLFARDLGAIGNYSAKFDWFYLDYHWRDWLGIRAGRVKTPFGLYNEINDIDQERVPILLPQSTYPVTSRDFLLAQTGVELYGQVDLDIVGSLEYVGYAGTYFLDTSTTSPASPFQVLNFTTPYVVGGRLMWNTPLEGLRAGFSIQNLKLDGDFLISGSKNQLNTKILATLWVGSLEYVW